MEEMEEGHGVDGAQGDGARRERHGGDWQALAQLRAAAQGGSDTAMTGGLYLNSGRRHKEGAAWLWLVSSSSARGQWCTEGRSTMVASEL
jgi:hypothetical protein